MSQLRLICKLLCMIHYSLMNLKNVRLCLLKSINFRTMNGKHAFFDEYVNSQNYLVTIC